MTERPQRMSAVRDSVPAHVEAAVNRALAKLPADRWSSAAQFAEALVQAGATGAGADVMRAPQDAAAAARVMPRAVTMRWFGFGAAAAFVLALCTWAAFGRADDAGDALAYRFTIPAVSAGEPVVSPDGRYLVYTVGSGLLLRALDKDQATSMDGTEGARSPFWSPDSKWIAFFSAGQLKKVAVSGGLPQTLTAVPKGRATGSWSTKGTMLIELTESPENEGWFVLASGASSLKKFKVLNRTRVRTPEKAYPSFLPDGEHFLFTQPVNDVPTLMVGSIDGAPAQPLVPSDSRGVYASEFILYVRQGTLFAHPFEAATRTTSGEPIRLLDDIEFFAPMGKSVVLRIANRSPDRPSSSAALAAAMDRSRRTPDRYDSRGRELSGDRTRDQRPAAGGAHRGSAARYV
jgi:serine/threonine-protein kinase